MHTFMDACIMEVRKKEASQSNETKGGPWWQGPSPCSGTQVAPCRCMPLGESAVSGHRSQTSAFTRPRPPAPWTKNNSDFHLASPTICLEESNKLIATLSTQPARCFFCHSERRSGGSASYKLLCILDKRLCFCLVFSATEDTGPGGHTSFLLA
jgi:hypothetical protein